MANMAQAAQVAQKVALRCDPSGGVAQACANGMVR